VAARVNNALTDLQSRLNTDAEVSFFDLRSGQGVKVYERSLTFVLIIAAQRLFPGKDIVVEHSLGNGVYFEWLLGRPVTETDVELLQQAMSEIIADNLPIVRHNLPLSEAIHQFETLGNMEKARLLRQVERDTVSLYTCSGVMDYFYGPMVPETVYLKHFELKYYAPGFMLLFPDKTDPNHVAPFVDNPKLAQIFLEAERWGELLGCSTVAHLNENLAAGGFIEIMRIAEALHEKKVAAIADMVDVRRRSVKIILIAGPSSSGKTTFIQRLGIQLRILGIRPVPISLDDYFLEREQSPKDSNGDYDFESIHALDLPLFNDQLVQLLEGKVVEPPCFNFKTGRREYPGKKIQVGPDHVLIVEGIHGLNPDLTPAIPRNQKMLIFISALTQLAIDNHNRIPTTDTRLIRRIVRDNQFRSHDALQTIRIWPSVRSGEEVNIFPFQEQADVMFNSALIYELAVLRQYAEPLLAKITPEYPEYLEARRLTGFLRHFRLAPADQVPSTSILREFIG
jgi:uridine kinase